MKCNLSQEGDAGSKLPAVSRGMSNKHSNDTYALLGISTKVELFKKR